MRALRQIREVPSGVDGSLESLLAQFSASTLELNPALGSQQLCNRLTARATEMLGARAAVLALGGPVGMANYRSDWPSGPLGRINSASVGLAVRRTSEYADIRVCAPAQPQSCSVANCRKRWAGGTFFSRG